MLLKKKHLGEEEPLAPEYRSDNSLSIEYASPPPYISATQSQYQNSITFISILVSISASLSIFLFYFYFRSFFLISSNGNISVSVSIFLCNSVSSRSPSPKCFIFYFIFIFNNSFFFLLIPKFMTKKEEAKNDVVLAHLMAASNWSLTKYWIDNNWKLEDWNDKTES